MFSKTLVTERKDKARTGGKKSFQIICVIIDLYLEYMKKSQHPIRKQIIQFFLTCKSVEQTLQIRYIEWQIGT